jgi:dephospho-CoA kinase
MVVGLLGGIGSGKSTVASLLAESGAEVVDADRLAHEVLRTPEGRSRVVSRFGREVLGPDGELDRKRLAAVVFADRRSLEDLNAIIHPAVLEEILARVRSHRAGARRGAGSASGLLVLDVPLLSESPLRNDCDALVFVDAEREVRQERLRVRGWDSGELERRESFQAPLEEKSRMAGFRIDNSGSLEETRAAVGRLVASLLSRGPGDGEMKAAK